MLMSRILATKPLVWVIAIDWGFGTGGWHTLRMPLE